MIERLRQLVLQSRDSGRLKFIFKNIIGLGFLYTLVILALILIGKFIIDLNIISGHVPNYLADYQILLIFAFLEATLGLCPPDLIILWTAKFDNPFPMLFLIGIISYGAGFIAYYIGLWISNRPAINRYMEKRLERYIRLTKKWGGTFIAIAALFPFTPYPLVVLGVSVLRFPVRKLVWYGLFRVIRFVLQGALMFNTLNL